MCVCVCVCACVRDLQYAWISSHSTSFSSDILVAEAQLKLAGWRAAADLTSLKSCTEEIPARVIGVQEEIRTTP